MIVKVMGVKPEEFELWDDISHIEVRPIEEQGPYGIDQSRTYKVMGRVFDETRPASGGMAIHYHNKIGDWCAILFNTIAYICADNGKTIEIVRG